MERDHLDHVYPLPAAYHAVRMNDRGEMAVLTGQGTAHAAPRSWRWDLILALTLSHAYWIMAGIAGGNPGAGSLGSAAWARWVVDGDLGYEIDAREIPKDWTTGYIPLRKTQALRSAGRTAGGPSLQLNAGLADWAFD